MAAPRIALEQWRALLAVVEAGGYAQAAATLHKTQSSITYAVKKIESLLGVKVFEIKGRKAQLTEAGEVLYRRARTLVEEAVALERGALPHLAPLGVPRQVRRRAAGDPDRALRDGARRHR